MVNSGVNAPAYYPSSLYELGHQCTNTHREQ
jgi:hypothetical protein